MCQNTMLITMLKKLAPPLTMQGIKISTLYFSKAIIF